MKENEEEVEINLKELFFIIENTEYFYNKFTNMMKERKLTKLEGHTLYTLIALSLVAIYRNNREITIKDKSLMIYVSTVQAIVNKDNIFLERLLETIGKNYKKEW